MSSRGTALCHRRVHPQKQPIVWQAGIIDSVLIDDQAADQSAKFKQRVPVASVARQARRLDRHDGADPALANGGNQPFKPGARDPRSGAAEIFVEDDDLLPAQLSSPTGERLLTAAALMIVLHLVERRLPNIDVGRAPKVVGGDFTHPPLPSSSPIRPLTATEPAPASAPAAGSSPLLEPRSRERPAPPPGWQTDPIAAVEPCASSPPRSDWDAEEDRIWSNSRRKSCKAARASRGGEWSGNSAASHRVIHAGRCAKVPSGCSIT
jgi:hypothetical protein